jgi:Cytochrome bd terminal oxidase subunit II
MDGFDLGLGILFPLFPAKADRDVIMNSVAPVWDGNETWLVLGGGGVMAEVGRWRREEISLLALAQRNDFLLVSWPLPRRDSRRGYRNAVPIVLAVCRVVFSLRGIPIGGLNQSWSARAC